MAARKLGICLRDMSLFNFSQLLTDPWQPTSVLQGSGPQVETPFCHKMLHIQDTLNSKPGLSLWSADPCRTEVGCHGSVSSWEKLKSDLLQTRMPIFLYCTADIPTWVKYAVGWAQYCPSTGVHLQTELTLWLPIWDLLESLLISDVVESTKSESFASESESLQKDSSPSP